MKKLAIIAILTAFGVAAAACGDSKPANTPTDTMGSDAGATPAPATTDTPAPAADGGAH